MANLQTAKQAARQFGVAPPAGIVDGTPQYDEWVQAWFEGGVDAGDPRFVQMAGGRQAEENEGGIADFSGAADSGQWMGKRKPTPRELRKWAADQHARYISGDSSAQDEDYERYDDRQLAAWIAKSWDVGGGGFKNAYGDTVAKPPDAGPNTPPGKTGEGAGGGGEGGGGRAPQPPPPPVTFGTQLTGGQSSPLQQMLIDQYNTGMDTNTGQPNLFGLGMDRSVGGAGVNADVNTETGQNNPNRMAQSLGGGGLWWSEAGKDAFGGWDASQKNAEGPATPSPGATTPAAQGAVRGKPAAPTGANTRLWQERSKPQPGQKMELTAPGIQGKKGFQYPKPTPISGMMMNQFQGR